MLTDRGIAFRYGHDLQLLMNLPVTDGVVLPAAVTAAAWLTPYGTQWRYASPTPKAAGVPGFDREQAILLAAAGVAWAEQRLPEI